MANTNSGQGRSRLLRLGVALLLVAWQLNAHATTSLDESSTSARSDPAAQEPFIRATGKPPPGFEDLAAPQRTEADLYFNGEYLLSTLIEYDLTSVTIADPTQITQAIATLRNPGLIANALTGPLPTHSDKLCQRRAQADCGALAPETAAVLFDEGRFRLDLFVHPDQLKLQTLAVERYLPEPVAGLALLNEMNFSAAGQDGNDRFSLSAESFLSRSERRLRARYGLSNSGSVLYELSMQWDQPDREVELGSFRTFGRSLSLLNDADILGLRVASSTNTRVDLDTTLGSPLLVFLDRRARVDLLRNGELLDSRFYDAGNQQLDTSRLPDGAYELTIRTLDIDGRERIETQFFVRSQSLPPKGEPQYYFEVGSLTDTLERSVPEPTGGTWARLGGSRRMAEPLALEAELLHAAGTNYATTGAFLFAPGWQLHLGLMQSDQGDSGYSVRGALQRGWLTWTFDYMQVSAAEAEPVHHDQALLSGSYTQGNSTLSFPFFKGHGFLRARVNEREHSSPEKGIGFSYLGPLFQRGGIVADLTFDSNIGNGQSWVRLGLNFRLRSGAQHLSASPQWQLLRDSDLGSDQSASLDARWTHTRHSDRFGDVQQGAYLLHDGLRDVTGSRLATQSRFGFADLDVAYERGDRRSGLTYSTNSRFSVVTQHGKTAMGGGNNQLAAVIVELDPDLPDTEFQILVNERVAGYVRPRKRGVISLPPYETYEIRVVPTGSMIFNYDQDPRSVTLYPGNVETLAFSAHQITVLVGQALFADGTPVARARIMSAEGVGATDDAGWFQIEISDERVLQVQHASGVHCELVIPALRAEDGLAVVEALTCQPTPAPRSD